MAFYFQIYLEVQKIPYLSITILRVGYPQQTGAVPQSFPGGAGQTSSFTLNFNV